MSAFGYGRSYYPMSSSPGVNPQLSPTYGPPAGSSVQALQSGVNFTPEESYVWGTPRVQRTPGGGSSSPQWNDPGNSTQNYNYQSDPWRNPFAVGGNFSGRNNLGGPSSDKSIADPESVFKRAYDSLPGKSGTNPMSTSLFAPTSPGALYEQIQGLNNLQLQGLRPDLGNIQDRFANVAQNYSNAYANPGYAASAPMSENKNAQMLRSAYQILIDRLNSSYLL